MYNLEIFIKNPVFFKLLVVLAAAIFMVVIFSPQLTYAQFHFGGPITLYNPICETPPGVWLMVGPPRPMSLFYMGGMFYSHGPPSHPGQWLLGMAAGWVPCIIWVPCGFAMCPIVIGGGSLIIYSGSSI